MKAAESTMRCVCLTRCQCKPRNPPWMHNHITSCPFYTWSEASRSIAFVLHSNHAKATGRVTISAPQTDN